MLDNFEIIKINKTEDIGRGPAPVENVLLCFDYPGRMARYLIRYDQGFEHL